MLYTILKRVYDKEKIFRKMLAGPERGRQAVSAKRFSNKFLVNEEEIDGFSLVSIAHPSSDDTHIFFLHGGAYFAEASNPHRWLIEKLVSKYHFKVSFFDYPLAPEHEAKYTIEITEKAFRKTVETYPEDTFCSFGDSAGGGLALALLQRLKAGQKGYDSSSTDGKSIEPGGKSSARGRNQSLANNQLPQKTVLFSPWLDTSLSNPEIEKYIDLDVLIHLEGIKECGRINAGSEGTGSPIASPIYGDLKGLGEILVFASDHEILYPDCQLLEQKAGEATGTIVNLRTVHKMVHDWILFPIKEARDALEEIVAFYRKCREISGIKSI